MRITKIDTCAFALSVKMLIGAASAEGETLLCPHFILPKNRMTCYLLGLFLIVAMNTTNAQTGYTIECPADEIINCEADLTPGTATFVERDTIKVESDDNIFYGTMDTENYADNPSLMLSPPIIAQGATITGVEINLSLLVVGNSCEEDIDIRVTDPMGNVTEFISPIPGCLGNNNNSLYLFSQAIDATELGQGNFGDWVIQMKDSDDQNPVSAGSPVFFVPPGTEYSLRFASIQYFTEKTEQIFPTEPTINGEPNCSGTEYTYTYETTAPNGDVLSCEKTFTLNNTPTISCPADAIVNCSEDISVDITNASFSVACGIDGTVNLSGPVLNGSANSPGATYTYTYTVQDECGGMASCEQVFTIENDSPSDCPTNVPYTIECPLNENINCEADLAPGTAIFTQKDTIEVGLDSDIYYGIMGTESYNDNPSLTFPEPIVPEGTTVTGGEMTLYLLVFGNSCEEDIDIRVTNPIGSVSEFISPISGCIGNDNNTLYLASIPIDAAGLGQDSFGDWVVQMKDSNDQNTVSEGSPAIFAPPGTEYSLRYSAIRYFTEKTEQISSTGPAISGEPNCPGTEYTYTYEATASNGDIISCEQIFTINDTPLIITCPADAVVTCAADIIVDASNASFSTTCDADGTISISDAVINGDANCSGTTHTYTYTAEDACGRTASCNQVFTIGSTEPTITCPADETVVCADEIVVGTADFETSCGLNGSIFTSGPGIDGEPNCPGTTYTYTFTAVDACGSQVFCNQVFTIQNDEPTITCLADMTVTCASEIAITIPVFNTTCGLDGGVSVEGPIVDGTPNCEGTTYTYTFSGTDDCGRIASCNQVFTIENAAPTITCPAGETVACAADISISTNDATFTTNCSLDTDISISEPVIDGDADCPGATYTYTYTVEDACGRTASCEQIFTIENNELTITCPADETVACASDILINANDATITTACELGANISVSDALINGEADCPGTTYTYIYTVEDACGRTASCEQVFTIENVLPTITCPADETVACASDISANANNATFTTACELGVNITISEPTINGNTDCPGTTYTYTYTIEDACGRTASCEQIFTIENAAPMISCPSDATVACFEEIEVDANDAIYTTSCDLGANVTVLNTIVDGATNCPGTTYTYTYTVLDACGRTASCNQVFTIGNTEPTITCPADETVVCAADIVVGTVDFETSCALNGSVFTSGPVIDGEPDCPGTTYTYTFTGIDACGRQVECNQVFTIENQIPTIACPDDMTVTCASEIAITIPVFNTTCGLGGNVSVDGPVLDGEVDCPGTTYTYTFTGIDDCGRTISCEQIFTIENEAPTIICPADETVACASDILVDANNATFTTACELGANISVSDTLINGEPDCPGTTYTYTYTVQDACGRTASCEQIFTIENAAPTITCPADETVSCASDILVNANDATFTTACELGANISVSDALIDGEPDCPGTTYTYIYTVEDACGRTAFCEQIFTIANALPTITCPADETVACASDISVNANNATFTTACELGANISVSDAVINGEADCPGTTYTYTYTVQDVCGRTASCEQVFTIENEAPTIICPVDETIACSADIMVDATNATFTTACELGANVSVSDAVINGEADCPGTTYTYTYTVEDVCGRTASCEQVFTIENEAPTITCPADMTVECSDDIIVGAADFETSCGLNGSVFTSGPTIDGAPDCPGTTYTYTFTAVDACGRQISCEQVFTIENEEPTIACPADMTVTCASEIAITIPVFNTTCGLGGNVSVDGPVLDGEVDCPGTTYTYTFTGIDDCGRIASCNQVFTIENEAPTITCPADETVSCASDILVDANNATFTTACELGANISVSDTLINGEPDCPGTTYTYTYTVEDACGRTAFCEQIFTIENALPTITCPADETVACASDILVNANDATFTIACELGANISVSDALINGEPDCPGTTYTYTYTVEDACGRTAFCEQIFTIANALPTITCPADETVACASDISVNANNATFTTACELGANISVSEPVISGIADCPGTTYTYTYTVEDACGRTASCEQIFTIENEAPTITCPPDAMVQCLENIEVDANDAIFTTSCGLGANVTVLNTIIDGATNCPGTTYTYTYTVLDACGRAASCNQVFTIENPEPTITCPDDVIVACAGDIVVGTAEFGTSCGLNNSVFTSGPIIDGEPDCPGTTYTYMFTVVDACGRQASCNQVFTIESEAPEILCPADMVVTCSAEIAVAIPTFSTSCGLGGDVSINGPVLDGEPDCPGTTYTYTFTGIDDCGRTISCEQIFTIESEIPIITCPTDETVACATDILVDANDAIFTTSCELGANVSISDAVINGEADCSGTTYTYTYTVEDVCGRTASCEQIFTIENELPTITCPADETAACASDISVDANNATFTTACELGANISVSDALINGEPDCPGTTYTYTYTVEDACGRTAFCEQIFTIANVLPTITCPADETVACASDISIDANNATFTTACELGANVSLSEPVIDGEADCPGTTYTYTYTVEDVCGRTASCEQVFTIENALPIISCPTDETVVCAADVLVNANDATYTTSCELGANVSLSEPVINGDADCPGTTYTYTYTVEDACGRMASCEQIFTIENAEPAISCPADTTATCAAEIVLGTAELESSCGLNDSVFTSGPVIDGEADCPGTTYTYTFTAADACGRQVSCNQVFTIENDAPTITCPADITIFDEIDIMVDTANVSFTTSCGAEATVSLSGPVIEGEPENPGTTYTYTYTVEDACGRTASCEQVFTIDNTPPTITCPSDETVTCATDIIVDAANASFTTTCDLGENVFVEGPIINGTADCSETTYTYTYIIRDECDRTASCEQIFTIENAPPTIICPADKTVTCAADIIVDIANVSFTVDCDDLEVDVSIEEPIINGDTDCPGTTYTYTYIVKDACGRTALCEQVFTIADTPLTISCPADITVECSAEIVVDANDATFSENCELGAILSVSSPLINGEADCPGTTYTYTYTIGDGCGRTASCEQIFTIENVGPTITCVEGYSVTCPSEIQVDTPEFTTSCGLGGVLNLSGPAIDGAPGVDGTTYTYTHTVTDVCGRMAVCEQVFTIINDCQNIDFDFDNTGNPLAPGTEIFDQYEGFTLTTNSPATCAVLFDTGNPGNNPGLGTPNEAYDGPGIGAGGTSNTEFQGNALIVSNDCNATNETIGQLIFAFECGVTIKTVDLLDIDCPDSEIKLYNKSGNLIADLSILEYGVNSFNEFEVNISGVYTMIVDLDCAGGVTGFTYCKDNTPGANCGIEPLVCYDYNINHGSCGAAWNEGDLSGTLELGNDIININVTDASNVLQNTQVSGTGLLVRSDPNTIDDEVIIYYELSKSSTNITFDITDIDLKNSITGQQEEVCIYGTLGDNPTEILPTITPLNGNVMVNGNCAEGGANSIVSGKDESILVEFTDCIDKITIVYGSSINSPTPNPDNGKIVIGDSIFTVEQCEGGCECLEDDDNDGVCNDEDICPGGNDLIDINGDGTPDDCEIQCDEYTLDFSIPGYNWSGHQEVESYIVENQTFDILITDGNDILESSYDNGAGLAIVTDASNADEEIVITYGLSQVASNVTFDIIDLDYTASMQQEAVCIYATLGDDPTQIMPTITSLNGSVAINGNCAEATVNSLDSGQPESILVQFSECIDNITIVYGTGSDMSIQDPLVGNITIGKNYGFITEICEGICPELREEEAFNANINLYPNPVYANDVTIEIDTETRGNAQLILIDALGRTISTENIELTNDITMHKLSTNQLTAGVYFVQLHTQKWRTNGMKLVVVKP